VPSVKGGDINKLLQLTAFVILRYFIETQTKATFSRTVPLNVGVLFVVCNEGRAALTK
jgi:hypothetical protein